MVQLSLLFFPDYCFYGRCIIKQIKNFYCRAPILTVFYPVCHILRDIAIVHRLKDRVRQLKYPSPGPMLDMQFSQSMTAVILPC